MLKITSANCCCYHIVVLLLALYCSTAVVSGTCSNYNHLNRFKDAASISYPTASKYIIITAGQTVVTQCQSKCGKLRWLLNGTYNNNDTTFLANCNNRPQCTDRNFIVCDADQSLIDMGPLTSNLTLTLTTPGVYTVQCQATLHGNAYSYLGEFVYYSRLITINVLPQIMPEMTSSPTPLSSSFIIPTSSSVKEEMYYSSCTNEYITVTTTLIQQSTITSSSTCTSSSVSGNIAHQTSQPKSTTSVSSIEVQSTVQPGPALTTKPISEDPVSITLITALCITTVLALLGWTGCIALYCKHKKTSCCHNNDDIESTTCSATNDKTITYNDYITVPSNNTLVNRTNNTDSGSSINSNTTPNDIQSSYISHDISHDILSQQQQGGRRHYSVKSQNSVETYSLPINSNSRVISATNV